MFGQNGFRIALSLALLIVVSAPALAGQAGWRGLTLGPLLFKDLPR